MMHRRAFLLTPVAACGTGWPSFRGPNASGVSDAKGIPLSWSTSPLKNIAWRTTLPGIGHSSPSVWGNRIWLTTAVAADPSLQGKPVSGGGIDSGQDVSKHAFRVLCVDRTSGKILWDSVASEGPPKIRRHTKASHANPTVATNGTIAVAFFGSEGLHAFDEKGRKLWSRDLGVLNVGLKGEAQVQWGFASSPVLFGDSVIVQCDAQDRAFVAAFDLRSGAPRWNTPRTEYPGWSTPVLYAGEGGPILITSGSRKTRAIDPRNGRELWSYDDETEVRVPAPVIDGQRVVITGGYPQGRRFFALDVRSGRELWNSPKGGSYTTTPVIYRDLIYICSDRGVLSCHSVSDGRLVYQERVAGGGNFSASPVVAEDRIWLASEDGDVHVVRTGSKFEVVVSGKFPEGIWATPAPIGKTMFVRTTAALYAVQA